MKINKNLSKAKVYISTGLLWLFFATTFSVQAEKITIGKGSGIVWEGLPFSASLKVTVKETGMYGADGLLAISYRDGSAATSCVRSDELYGVEGIQTLKLAEGVGLVPRASGSVSYVDYYTSNTYHVTGTIGFPQTRGQNTAGHSIVVPFIISGISRDWCLPPVNTTEHNTDYFYKINSDALSNISGDWAIVANGKQAAKDNIKIIPMYFSSTLGTQFSSNNILPTTVDLRISTLSCSVDTPTEINFGAVARNLTAHAELAQKNNEFYVACSQDSAGPTIDANINVQFRPLSGLYNGEVNKLALNQGGGYITGTIPGVTSEGSCGSAAAGVSFDNKPIKVGSIAKDTDSVTLSHQLDWRLCSGGASLPSGKVTASAEMLVTYN